MIGRSLSRAAVAAVLASQLWAAPAAPAAGNGAHAFAFTDIDGRPLPLSTFAGKAVLIVNTASQCGFTPQYEGLQALWRSYRDRGLVVLGVPSNDFGRQEPGTNEQIKSYCEVNWDIDFPLVERTVVSGAGAHPFYAWARAELGDAKAPRWNFHKYLVAPDGKLVAGFPSGVEPTSEALVGAIQPLLLRR